MIKNEQQYKILKSQLKKLEDSIQICQTQKNVMDENIFNSMITGLTSQVESLSKQIKEYEKLKAQSLPVIIYDLEEFPDSLIRARINNKLTHKQLGELVGLKTQQIQRYEQNNYQGISMQRAIQIGKILGVKLGNSLEVVEEIL